MFKFLNYLFILLFILAAIAQYNDVDAVRWIFVYAAASVISILFEMKRLHWAASTTVAVICFIWLLFIIPDLTVNGFLHMFGEVSMNQTGVETGREFMGLVIISGWMCMLTYKTQSIQK